ncbi:MAG: response regulator [Bacteroidota bacterium]
MKTLLIIEDNEDVRENLQELLELSNYEVFAAPNGREGAKLAIAKQPDLILCDVMMPQLDGYGVLRILSAREETADIPFIFLTAKSEQVDFRKGMNLGADDYITKPYDDVELLNAVEMRLKKSERIKQTQSDSGEVLNRFLQEARGNAVFESLIQECELRTYRKRDIIFEEGSHPRQVYFINKGKIKLYKSNEDGKEIITEIVKETDFIGYIPLIRNAPYSLSAEALEDCQLSLLPKDDFLSLLYKDASVAGQLIKLLAKHVTEIEERLLHLAYDSVRRRVADTLVNLYDRYEKDGHAEIKLLREDLAQLVGTSKETVIRTLSEFKEDGLVQLKGSVIVIADRKALEDLPY